MTRLWKACLNTLYGLGWALRHEQAVREELAVLAVALPVSFFVATSVAWWLALIGSLMALIIVELLNTAIEKLSDHVTPEHSHAIKIVKDLGSAAVFMALALAFIIWVAALGLRFLP
jgi:diacylglycerol kinase (ATP)